MLSVDLVTAILVATLGAGTPLALAAIGELVSERAGVLNLGVEGMMLVGAAVGFVATAESGSMVIGILAGMGAGIGRVWPDPGVFRGHPDEDRGLADDGVSRIEYRADRSGSGSVPTDGGGIRVGAVAR